MKIRRTLLVLGTRGIPAAHGGFETFAEHFALFMVAQGWHVVVYCQVEVATVETRVAIDHWRGIERRFVSVASSGPRATLEFDWHCVRDAASQPGVCLVLGYNGAVFLPYLRLHGRKIITNMDGIEWRRPKWGLAARVWFWVNEWIAARVSHRLVADHPAIAAHLATRRDRRAIAMIPYGGTPRPPAGTPADPVLRGLGLQPGRYLVSIARIEPDNNILTFVEAFSRRRRDAALVVVGTMDPANPYHRRVRAAASDEVMFPGAIYDRPAVAALRAGARAYLHGHIVGGTNPSLVEALWAGNAVIAHDNVFNRWTAGAAGMFFKTSDECARLIARILTDDAAVAHAGEAALRQAAARFNWSDILAAYEREALALLEAPLPAEPVAAVRDLAEQHVP